MHDRIENTAELLKSWLKKLAAFLDLNPMPTYMHDVIMLLEDDVDQDLRGHLKWYSKDYDIVVVKSFNNAAVPSASILDFNIYEVLVISPLYMLMYDSKVFMQNKD